MERKVIEGLSLEELEAMNKELEERAATSVAAAEKALRAVQLKEEDLAQNAETIVQMAARKAVQDEGVYDTQSKLDHETQDKENDGSRNRGKLARPASARRRAQQTQPSRIPSAPKATRESPSSSSSSRPSSVAPSSEKEPQSQVLASFSSDFDLPSRPDAKVRLYKARIKALEADLQTQETLLSQRTKDLNQKDVLVKQLKASQAKTEKENRAMRAALEKYQKTQGVLRAQLEEKENMLEEATRTGNKASREKVKMEKDMKSREVRMQRAIEEIDRYKSMVDEMKSLEKDKRYVNREDHLRVVQEKTKLEKQKNELLSVFKKQSKLVDVLKRQKVHLEAATALKFTEDEFLKTLEISAP